MKNTIDNITLNKIERDCPFNKQPENTRKKLYDFQVLIAGEHRATWARRSAGGMGYYLRYVDDGLGIYDPASKWLTPVEALRQEQLLDFTVKYQHLIPDRTTYARRAEHRELAQAKEVARRAEEDYQERLRNAAPELLKALSDLVATFTEAFSLPEGSIDAAPLKAAAPSGSR